MRLQLITNFVYLLAHIMLLRSQEIISKPLFVLFLSAQVLHCGHV